MTTPANTTRTVRVIIDPTAAQSGAASVNAALASIGASANASGSAVTALQNHLGGLTTASRNAAAGIGAANSNLSATGGHAQEASGSIVSMTGNLIKMSLALAGIGFLVEGVHALAHAFIEAADGATEVNARLMSFANNQKQYNDAQRDVAKIAAATRSPMEGIAEVYQKIGIQADHLHMSTAQVGMATKVFAETLKLSGSTASQAKGAMIQLGDAFDVGRLNGRHFTAMMMDNIVFMRALAVSMGVPMGAMRELAKQGKITGEEIKKALTDPKIVDDIEKRFGRLPVSFHDVRTSIHNTLLQLAGDFMAGGGINTSLAVLNAKIVQLAASAGPFFTRLGKNISEAFAVIGPVVLPMFQILGAVLGVIGDHLGTITKLAMTALGAFVAWKTVMAFDAAMLALDAMAFKLMTIGGITTADTGLTLILAGAWETLTAAMMANPIGLLLVGLTALGVAAYEFSDSIKLTEGHVASLGDEAAITFDDMIAGLDDLQKALAITSNAVGGVVVASFNMLCTEAVDDFNIMKAAVYDLGAAIGAAIASGVNSAIGFIEGLVNKSIDGINAVKGVVPFGLGGAAIGHQTLGRMSANPLGRGGNMGLQDAYRNSHRMDGNAAIGKAWAPAEGAWSDFRKTTDARHDSYQGRADNRALGRFFKGQKPDTTPDFTHLNPPPGGDTDSDAAKKGRHKKDPMENIMKKYREFMAMLDETAKVAGMLPLEAENYNKQLELRKILGAGDLSKARELTQAEKDKITASLALLHNNQALAAIGEQARQAANVDIVNQSKRVGLTQAQQKVEDELAKLRLDALNKGATLVELNSKEYKGKEDILRTQLLINAAKDHELAVAKQLADAGSNNALEAFKKYNPQGAAAADRALGLQQNAQARLLTPDQQKERATAMGITIEQWREGMDNADRLIEEKFQKAMVGIAQNYYNNMSDAISQIASVFSGKIGGALSGIANAFKAISDNMSSNTQHGLLGGISKLFGGPNENRNGFGQSVDSAAQNFLSPQALQTLFTNPVGSMTSAFNGFKSLFSGGQGFGKAVGSAIGGAMQGAAIGGAVAGIGKMVWSKFSTTGAEIGGALGSIFGPIGSLVGSLGGGIIGGLLKKSQSGGVTVSGGADGYQLGATLGNNAGMKAAGTQAGNSVISGLQSIASALGGGVGSFGNISIGQYKGDWRVNTDGGALGGKHVTGNLVGASSEADATRIAIQYAIKMGAITGLTAFSEKVLQGAKNLDEAIQLAKDFEAITKAVAAFDNPMKAAVDAVLQPIDKMVKQMRQYGASADDFAKVEKYREKALKDVLDQQLSSLKDFQKVLNGSGSGVTDFNRLQADLGQFTAFQNDIKAGKSIDQGKFTALGQEIFQLAGTVFGSTTVQFQDIRSMLTAATNGAITNATNSFDNATVAAVNASTDAIVANQNTQTTLLQQLVANTGGSKSTGGGTGAVNAVNGMSAIDSY